VRRKRKKYISARNISRRDVRLKTALYYLRERHRRKRKIKMLCDGTAYCYYSFYRKRMINFTKFRAVLICGWLLSSTCAFVFGQAAPQTSPASLPPPSAAVNDFAGVIDVSTRQRLEQKLRRLRENVQPPIQVAVVTVQTTGGQDIFDYSLNVARGWEQKGDILRDNPWALLVVAINDRKYFTQVSQNLEGDLTDGEAGQIQRERLVPAFRQGNYGKGIEDTVDAYIQNIAQSRGFDAASIIGATVQPPPAARERTTTRRQSRSSLSLGTCCLLIVVGFIILFIMSAGSRRGGGGRGRGGWGGGGGDLLSGLILGSVLSNMGRGGDGGWSGGGFGGSGGGDSGGGWGGFGGGGDGGFGGGSEWGGGGAGGDW
jgi:uncharacterized protein